MSTTHAASSRNALAHTAVLPQRTVERRVVMPSRAASRLASVLLPVPLVPQSSTATLLRRSRILDTA